MAPEHAGGQAHTPAVNLSEVYAKATAEEKRVAKEQVGHMDEMKKLIVDGVHGSFPKVECVSRSSR